MSMLARFEEQHPQGDRRSAARRSLRLALSGAEAGSGDGELIIHDLSATGLLLETATRLSVGETFQVHLPEATATEALVVWNSGRFYGCQFKRPIPTAALSAAALQSAFPSHPSTPAGDTDLVAELRALTLRVESVSLRIEQIMSRLLDRSSERDSS